MRLTPWRRRSVLGGRVVKRRISNHLFALSQLTVDSARWSPHLFVFGLELGRLAYRLRGGPKAPR